MSYVPPVYLSLPDQALDRAFVEALREQVKASRELAEAAHASGDVQVWRDWIQPATREAAALTAQIERAMRMTRIGAKETA